MAFNRIVEPTTEPVSLAEVKAHLRIDGTDEDALLKLYIAAAIGYVEEYLWRALCTQTWELAIDGIPGAMVRIPRPPLQSVASVVYLDDNGVENEISPESYIVATRSEPGYIMLRNGCSWPSTSWPVETFRIRYVAGYGDSTSIPVPIKQAILLQIGHLYEHRESVITGTIVSEMPMATQALLSPYRMAVI